MPYIAQDARRKFDEALAQMPVAAVAGELNYIFTKLAVGYISAPGRGNYQAINDVVGALEGAKLELYRRLAAPYEDTKIDQNGDVYPVGV
jgi:hypothetical protein